MIRRRKHDRDAAVAAQCRAEQQLETARARDPEVKRLTALMRRHGEANHFAERLNMRFRGTT